MRVESELRAIKGHVLRVSNAFNARVFGIPPDEAAVLEKRRPMGAAALAGGMAAAGAGAVLAGTVSFADPRVIGLAQQAGISFPAGPAGIFMVALGGLLLVAAWGLWRLRLWAWWSTLALALGGLALSVGSVALMLGALVLIVYLADIHRVFDGKSGNNGVGGHATT